MLLHETMTVSETPLLNTVISTLPSCCCFVTHPSLWWFQPVPANDCDPFNFAYDEGPSNSPQSLLDYRKKVVSEINVVAMTTFWQPPPPTKSPHNEEHWLFPTSILRRRGGAAREQRGASPSPNPSWRLEKEQQKPGSINKIGCWTWFIIVYNMN